MPLRGRTRRFNEKSWLTARIEVDDDDEQRLEVLLSFCLLIFVSRPLHTKRGYYQVVITTDLTCLPSRLGLIFTPAGLPRSETCVPPQSLLLTRNRGSRPCIQEPYARWCTTSPAT